MNRSGGPAEEDAKTTDRRKLHCDILRLERDLSLKRTERERGLPIAYENRIGKAELVEHWPGKRAEIREAVRSGRARTRKMAALIFTGGAAGVGAYYALQYGFYGLGMVLELTLLGVSREFEEEPDQLGAQYAWRAGYDPLIATFSEVGYLPRKADLKFDSTRFQDMKRQLKSVLKPAPGDPKKQPKLRRFPECDDEEPSRSKTGEC